MSKKKMKSNEMPQEIVLTYVQDQDKQETPADPETIEPEDIQNEPGLVRYRVTAPRGIYVRIGPGRAYQEVGVLPCGGEVMGEDLAGMLRPSRKPGETAWIVALAQGVTGWVDTAFLERIP